jgi:hypothetical protein
MNNIFIICCVSSHLDISNKFNYIFSIYFQPYDFADILLSLFSLLPFASLQENVNDEKCFSVIKSYQPSVLHVVLLKAAICIGCFFRYYFYELFDNNYFSTFYDVIEKKYFIIFDFLYKISEDSSSYYYYHFEENENNFYSNEIHTLKDNLKYWREMRAEYKRIHEVKEIKKLI